MSRRFQYSRFALSLFTAVLCFVLPGSPVFAGTIFPTSSPTIASLFHFAGSPPKNLGVNGGKLSPCPSSPNCVSSQGTDPEHYIEPFTSDSDLKETFAKLKETIDSLKEAQIVQADERYIYAEFTSKLMGFVDDVEFYLDETMGTIEVRSASRLGESDLGVNRKRIEAIREQLK